MSTPSITEREQSIYKTIRDLHSLGTPTTYSDNNIANLIELTQAVETLIEDIHNTPRSRYPDPHDADNSPAIVATICLTELDRMHEDINEFSISITQDCAERTLRSGRPLDQLDLNIAPNERIMRLLEALGEAAPYWISGGLNETERSYREENIAMLAYQAAAVIVSSRHQLTAE